MDAHFTIRWTAEHVPRRGKSGYRASAAAKAVADILFVIQPERPLSRSRSPRHVGPVADYYNYKPSKHIGSNRPTLT